MKLTAKKCNYWEQKEENNICSSVCLGSVIVKCLSYLLSIWASMYSQVLLNLWIKIDTCTFLISSYLKAFSHTLWSLTFFSEALHLMSKAHVMNKYEASSGCFMTSIIFVEIKAPGWMPFLGEKKKGQMTFHQSVYTNVFINVARKFIRWLTVRHVLLFQEHSQIHGYTQNIVLQSSC